MNNFYVGQKVRIVACENENMKKFIGHEGFITQRSTLYPDCSWRVSGAETIEVPCHFNPNHTHTVALEWHYTHLEPIIDPGIMEQIKNEQDAPVGEKMT